MDTAICHVRVNRKHDAACETALDCRADLFCAYSVCGEVLLKTAAVITFEVGFTGGVGAGVHRYVALDCIAFTFHLNGRYSVQLQFRGDDC